MSKLKGFLGNESDVSKMITIFLWRVEKIVGKGDNAGYHLAHLAAYNHGFMLQKVLNKISLCIHVV